MAALLIGIAILITALPALLVISACISASRTSHQEEIIHLSSKVSSLSV